MKAITSGTRSWLAWLAIVMLLAACDNSERNVITERAPFFQKEVAFDGARTDAVIGAVQSFSTQHRMDFLLARKSLPPGDFNASANGPSLNLSAMHIGGWDKGVSISAIARSDPTPEDKALVDEFVAQIRKSSGVAD
jgi:hypothetical protein